MPVYSVEGKLGTGKTKFCVRVAKLALLAGRRVASNLDLRLDKLCPGFACEYVRLPDKPTAADLEAAGHGNPDSYDEDRNGVMILDELGTWLNSRSFQDKARAPLVDWLIHARKHGWDVYLIVQNANMIDRQVREALIEYSCNCMRLDKVRVPVFGHLLGAVGGVLGVVPWVRRRFNVKRWGFLPRMHLVSARIGSGLNVVVAQRWIFRGDEFNAAYDTRQVFRADYDKPSFVVRYDPPPAPRPWWHSVFEAPSRPPLKEKLPEVAACRELSRDEAWARAVALCRLS